ncbi:MAG: oxidoreductase [Actinobacteria bacterium 69-20]|jgi:Ni,Fe-hydrogenase III small subunit|nr:oxidoreductase [Actinomycetota bacterium]OJV23645.1 MAG: oxidoreductase [Actinobacteria bacterium 69-20]
MGWPARIRRIGRIAEHAPPQPLPITAAPALLRGSLQIRYVDVGSCGACELEIASAFGPIYDLQRYGISLVASPRHADALLVTGVVTRNMEAPLRHTLAAVPEPRIVIAVGDCACTGGVFTGGYGVVGPVSSVIDVDLEIPGCPPRPEQIVAALRSIVGR